MYSNVIIIFACVEVGVILVLILACNVLVNLIYAQRKNKPATRVALAAIIVALPGVQSDNETFILLSQISQIMQIRQLHDGWDSWQSMWLKLSNTITS